MGRRAQLLPDCSNSGMPENQDLGRAQYRCKVCGKSYKSYEEMEAHERDCLRDATEASSEPETNPATPAS
jgi:hypothetical protein